MADCHLGAFRDPILRRLNLEAFLRALKVVREEDCDFLIIAGDLFDTTLPDMTTVEEATAGLRALRDGGVPIYVFYGSHDRSLSEKGIVDVLEAAGLFENVGILDGSDAEGEGDRLVQSLVRDEGTGAVMFAIGGRRLTLERSLFETMDWGPVERAIEDAPLAIFGYHGPIEGMIPAELGMLETVPRKRLPSGFSYYALGHVHAQKVLEIPGGGTIAYPGTTFGGSFTDLADGRDKGLLIVDCEKGKGFSTRSVPIEVAPLISVDVGVAGRTSQEAKDDLSSAMEGIDAEDSVVLLRVHGSLSQGRPTDLSIHAVRDGLIEDGARAVFVNRRGLRKAAAIEVEGGDGDTVGGENRREIEARALSNAMKDYQPPLEWLRGDDGISLARELLDIVGEGQGDLSSERYTKSILERSQELLALHKRPGPTSPSPDTKKGPSKKGTLDAFGGGEEP
jgi:DNA repair exonuclease SbcCD nuclease subunit